MGAHTAPRTCTTGRLVGRSALTVAAALALTGGTASFAFAGQASEDTSCEDSCETHEVEAESHDCDDDCSHDSEDVKSEDDENCDDEYHGRDADDHDDERDHDGHDKHDKHDKFKKVYKEGFKDGFEVGYDKGFEKADSDGLLDGVLEPLGV